MMVGFLPWTCRPSPGDTEVPGYTRPDQFRMPAAGAEHVDGLQVHRAPDVTGSVTSGDINGKGRRCQSASHVELTVMRRESKQGTTSGIERNSKVR